MVFFQGLCLQRIHTYAGATPPTIHPPKNMANTSRNGGILSSLLLYLLKLTGNLRGPFDFKIATPLVAMLTALPASFSEVHMGLTKIPGKNKGAKDQGRNITAYGLNNSHIPLLHGVTSPPERRTSLLKGLGPLTLALMLIEEKTFKEKIKDALTLSIKHLPNAASIVEALSNGTWRNTSLLKNLADVLLITSHRSARRIYFPILSLKYLTEQNLDLFNFTGIKGVNFYHALIMGGIRMKCDDVSLAA